MSVDQSSCNFHQLNNKKMFSIIYIPGSLARYNWRVKISFLSYYGLFIIMKFISYLRVQFRCPNLFSSSSEDCYNNIA